MDAASQLAVRLEQPSVNNIVNDTVAAVRLYTKQPALTPSICSPMEMNSDNIHHILDETIYVI